MLEIKYAYLNPGKAGNDKISYNIYKTSLPTDSYKRMKVLAYVRAWFSTDTFSEVGLPYLIFYIAILLGFLNWLCIDYEFIYASVLFVLE